jgi:hypothetical protein
VYLQLLGVSSGEKCRGQVSLSNYGVRETVDSGKVECTVLPAVGYLDLINVSKIGLCMSVQSQAVRGGLLCIEFLKCIHRTSIVLSS